MTKNETSNLNFLRIFVFVLNISDKFLIHFFCLKESEAEHIFLASIQIVCLAEKQYLTVATPKVKKLVFIHWLNIVKSNITDYFTSDFSAFLLLASRSFRRISHCFFVPQTAPGFSLNFM